MVMKEEVVQWFKGLESYKRIDAMCTLLNMCLPFELRFLGTCLEELGGRDSKELRGIELRVNNPNELAQEIASAQLSDPSDIKVRRKMALYFALIRACSRPCVNELFNILCEWNNDEFLERAKGDALQELLLVFTMAARHPVFSYEQRTKCGEIYNKILYGVTETVFGEVPCDMRSVIETNPAIAGQSNVIYPQKHMPQNEHVVCTPVFSIQNPTANVAPVSFDQNRGSQIVHREIVNISPHHIYAENVQPVYHQNVTHVCPSTASSNLATFTVSRANQMNQAQPIQAIPNPQQQQQQQQQHISNITNATNLTYSLQNLSLVDNNVVFLNSDGIPIMRKSESDSASSGESNDDSTPPDTPHTSDPTNNSMVGNSSNNSSSINKKYKGLGDGGKQQISRHKVATILQHQQQQHQPHIVYSSQMMTPIPISAAIQTSDIVLTQQQHQQSQSQQTQISQTQPVNINSPSAIPAGYSIAANPSVIFQQYPAQSTHPIQKSQINTTYHYHTQHLPMNNRGSILGTTPNTTTSAPQPVPAGTYRMPTYHVQPNGDVIYPFPSTITYMQSPLAPRPQPPSSTSNQIQQHNVIPTPTPPLTMQHLPTLTSLSSKTNQTAIISPYLLANENSKPNTSCFNCGSSAHTGQECQEASMEDAKHYKLDYNTQLVNDTVKSTVSDLDNGGSGVKQSETITTHMPVLNK